MNRLYQSTNIIFRFAGRVVYHASLVVRLTHQLLQLLLKGSSKWMINLFSLILFILLLIPYWVYMIKNYLFSPTLIKNIEYTPGGSRNRNLLDLYLPVELKDKKTNNNTNSHPPKKPVIIFLCGGAWIIGYKMWSFFVCQGLADLGIICVVPDYRNFPQGNADDMLIDVNNAIKWTISNIHKYNGDPDSISIGGQSAGAHLAITLLALWYKDASKHKQIPTPTSSNDISPNKLDDSLDSLANDDNLPPDALFTWKTSPKSTMKKRIDEIRNTFDYADLTRIKVFIGISGPYNLPVLKEILHTKGLDSSIFTNIFNDDIDKYSPVTIFSDILSENSINHDTTNSIFPKVVLFHGSADKSVPLASSLELVDILKKMNITANCHVYEGWSHTDAILEGPMSCGGKHPSEYRFFQDMSKYIYATNRDGDNKVFTNDVLKANVDEVNSNVLIHIARFCNPF